MEFETAEKYSSSNEIKFPFPLSPMLSSIKLLAKVTSAKHREATYAHIYLYIVLQKNYTYIINFII